MVAKPDLKDFYIDIYIELTYSADAGRKQVESEGYVT